MAEKMTLSVALAVYNEEANIGRCLAAISDIAGEIVIVDGGSSDKTVEIAKQYGAIIVQTDNPPIFHINKQKALDLCHGEWILQLDADEVVSAKLCREILSVIKKKNTNAGYQMPRKNFFIGKWLSKGGQYPDYLIRLFKNGKGRLPCKSVHEQIEIDGEIGTLQEPLLHFTNNTLEVYWAKADTYTTLTALELRKKKTSTYSLFLSYCLVKPIGTFFSIYLRHKGFVDGWRGFQFALFSSLHFPLAYKKFMSLS